MKKISLFFLISLFCSQLALAEDVPPTVKKNLIPAFLIGDSDLNFLGLKVYHIALWSEEARFSYDKKFAIRILYDMNFSKEDLVKRSIDEIERLHALSAKEKAEYLASLEKIFNPIKKGDEKVALFIPQQGVSLFHEGNLVGRISDLKLARLFVDIWLDERGSYPKITKKILGKKI